MIGPLPQGSGGVTQILVIVDAFSKFVKLYALPRATSKAILNKIVKDYIPNVQKPECILSDNATQFTSELWKTTLGELGIRIKHISVYFPSGNITERYNKEIGRLLRSYCNEKHTKWPTMLEFVEGCLNNIINLTTGFTSSYVQTGGGGGQPNPIGKYLKHPEVIERNLPLESVWELACTNLKSKAKLRADKANKKIKPVEFEIGTQILVRTHYQSSAEERTIKKFFLLYKGPFYILRRAGPNSYVVGDGKGYKVLLNVLNPSI
ncbi:hypothetical protein JTB14_032843 [Gonioctena quinquepunctata]|nr:hypothetical protein JTB14_032843 [Gonioctena quinquepunctata]